MKDNNLNIKQMLKKNATYEVKTTDQEVLNAYNVAQAKLAEEKKSRPFSLKNKWAVFAFSLAAVIAIASPIIRYARVQPEPYSTQLQTFLRPPELVEKDNDTLVLQATSAISMIDPAVQTAKPQLSGKLQAYRANNIINTPINEEVSMDELVPKFDLLLNQTDSIKYRVASESIRPEYDNAQYIEFENIAGEKSEYALYFNTIDSDSYLYFLPYFDDDDDDLFENLGSSDFLDEWSTKLGDKWDETIGPWKERMDEKFDLDWKDDWLKATEKMKDVISEQTSEWKQTHTFEQEEFKTLIPDDIADKKLALIQGVITIDEVDLPFFSVSTLSIEVDDDEIESENSFYFKLNDPREQDRTIIMIRTLSEEIETDESEYEEELIYKVYEQGRLTYEYKVEIETEIDEYGNVESELNLEFDGKEYSVVSETINGKTIIEISALTAGVEIEYIYEKIVENGEVTYILLSKELEY